jgi:hypothetical protein
MIRFLARWFAKRKYVFTLELNAAESDINANLAANRAKERRDLTEQLNQEADDIDKSITDGENDPELQALTGQEKYEADREKKKPRK